MRLRKLTLPILASYISWSTVISYQATPLYLTLYSIVSIPPIAKSNSPVRDNSHASAKYLIVSHNWRKFAQEKNAQRTQKTQSLSSVCERRPRSERVYFSRKETSLQKIFCSAEISCWGAARNSTCQGGCQNRELFTLIQLIHVLYIPVGIAD